MTKNDFLLEVNKLGISLNDNQLADLDNYAKFLLEYNCFSKGII